MRITSKFVYTRGFGKFFSFTTLHKLVKLKNFPKWVKFDKIPLDKKVFTLYNIPCGKSFYILQNTYPKKKG